MKDVTPHPRSWALVAAAVITAGACAEPTPDGATFERVPKVLLIGIDGVRPDVLAEVATPNLDALIADGAFSDRARTGFPSVSGPGWSSMLNGVWPDKHGVTGNDFDDDNFEAFPDFLSRIEMVRPELETFAVVDWVPLVRSEDGRHTIGDNIDTKIVLDGYELGRYEADSISVDHAVRALTTSDPDAMFVYLGNPDETSHQHGSIGTEYRQAIAAADALVGRLLTAVRSRATFEREDWLILSSTDHGRTESGGHGGDTDEERTIYFLASGASTNRGSIADSTFIVDVPVTALTHLGIAIEPAWDLDGRAVGLRR